MRSIGISACVALALCTTAPRVSALNANVAAQLSWNATTTVTNTTVTGSTTVLNLFVRFTNVESFKGAEIDLRWDPPGDKDAACVALASAFYKTSAGTSCTYLNRGTTVPVTVADENGHFHVAWANAGSLQTCSAGSVIQMQFDLSGCGDPATEGTGTWRLCSALILDSLNVSRSITSLGTPATTNNDTSHSPGCNQPPVLSSLSNQTIVSGEHLQFAFSASDPESDPLTLTVWPLPLGATAQQTANTLTVDWTPLANNSQIGEYALTATAFDGRDSVSAPFTIDVLRLNHAPTITAIMDQSVTEGAELVVPLSASDQDGDPFTLTLGDNAPAGAAITGGAFRWTPSAQAAQVNNGVVSGVGIVAADNFGASSTETFDIHVTDLSPPTISFVADQVVKEGSMLVVAPTIGGNTDGDPLLTYGVGMPAGVTVDPQNAVLSWTPTFAQAGFYENVSLCASDGASSQCATFSITVTDVNRDPVLTAIMDQFVAVGSTLSVIPEASDPDSDPLTWSGQNVPGGAAFDAMTGAIEWTPQPGDSGVYPDVTLTVEDGKGGMASTMFTITVALNSAPSVDPIVDQTIAELTLLTVTPSATDPESDPLTWSGMNLPNGAAVDPASGVLAWTPPCGSAGTYPDVTLRAQDVFGGVGSASFAIAVTDVCTPAVAISAAPSHALARDAGAGPFTIRVDVLGDASLVHLRARDVSLEYAGESVIAKDVAAGAGARTALVAFDADAVLALLRGASERVTLVLVLDGETWRVPVDVVVAGASFAVGPSPARGSAVIHYVLNADAVVHLAVYGSDGRLVRTLRDGAETSGAHTVTWAGEPDARAGVYFVRGTIGRTSVSSRLVFVP